MRFTRSKRVSYDADPNMTPLVDVVMVILIFLMLAGSFGFNHHYLAGKMFVSAEPDVAQMTTPPDEIVEIQIFPDATYGFRVVSGDIRSAGRVPDANWLADELSRKRGQYERHGTSTDQLQVVLFPSANTRYDHIASVYEAALRAKFKKIAFRTSYN